MPYYIAALTIEHTYWELTGEYIEFENICWMDTLDSGVKNYETLTAYFTNNDNVKRMSRQQESDIRVTIANPPYNAVQTSLNNANPAAKYSHIDKAIQESYYKTSRAGNKNKSFDMYKRFLRWSSDRIRGNGTVVFISNNSFLDAKADVGIRKALYNEFDHIYIVNLKGNARLAGDAWHKEGAKIFGSKARVGICISFFVKTGEGCSDLQYAEVDDYAELDEKTTWLNSNTISTLDFRTIMPDKNSTWLNQTNNDFEDMIPVLPTPHQKSIFDVYTLGVTSAKDKWAHDMAVKNLELKMKYYIHVYMKVQHDYHKMEPKPTDLIEWVDKKIKWSDATLDGIQRQIPINYSKNNIEPILYRPFVVKYQYYADTVTERPRKFREFFSDRQKNKLIVFPNPAKDSKFNTLATDIMTDLGCMCGSQNIPLWRYEHKDKISNITGYGRRLFQVFYSMPNITDENIFYYVYAMFNDPKYEEKYRYNLRRQLPRVPLAKNFIEWSKIGQNLFDLHHNFNNAKPYGLRRINKDCVKKNSCKLSLKFGKKDGTISIDSITTLEGIPTDVLEWKLGPKTPLEWILEFYKYHKNLINSTSSDDESVRNKFNTYKFDDHKEDVIKLLDRVTTVCVETVNLRKKLKAMKWGPQPKSLASTLDGKNRKALEPDSARSRPFKLPE